MGEEVQGEGRGAISDWTLEQTVLAPSHPWYRQTNIQTHRHIHSEPRSLFPLLKWESEPDVRGFEHMHGLCPLPRL